MYEMRGEMEGRDCEGVIYKKEEERRGVCEKWKRGNGSNYLVL